jgi:hypothetical protein
MTLENLLAIHKLQAVASDKEAIAKLIAAAARNLADEIAGAPLDHANIVVVLEGVRKMALAA